jgi:uncharacterized small protein (DUF1192 family)
MGNEGSTTPERPESRPEDEDDYDLLTYGEVAARISEVLTEERAHLAELRAAAPADETAIAALQARIAELVAGRERYANQRATSEAFLRRFGLAPRDPGSAGGRA